MKQRSKSDFIGQVKHDRGAGDSVPVGQLRLEEEDSSVKSRGVSGQIRIGRLSAPDPNMSKQRQFRFGFGLACHTLRSDGLVH